MTHYKLLTSTKAEPVTILSEHGWTVFQSESTDGDDVAKFYKNVGTLYRCVRLRSDAIRRLPWRILNEREKELWVSTEQKPPPALVWCKNIRALNGLTEAALILKAQAFWHKERNRAGLTGLRWFAPVSMKPVWDKEKGLVRFERKLSGLLRPVPLAVDDIVYTWLQDPLHETEPDQPPAGAAMIAAGVLYNTNLFTSGFLERGAIKATLLTVQGQIAPQEKERLKSWWKRFFGGARNAGNAEVLAADVKPVVVGEGLQELSNTELTGENREEIATTLGVPHSMVFSNAANYATSQVDKLNFHDETVIPAAEFIMDSLNEQLFHPLGLQFEFLPEQLDIYQEDENKRAQSFSMYTRAGMKPSIAAEILGIDLPHGVEYADLDPEEKKEPEPVPPQFQPGAQPPAQLPMQPDPEQAAEKRAVYLDKWRRMVRNRHDKGKSVLHEFDADGWLSPLEIAYIRSRLATATTKDAIDAAFLPQEEGGAGQGFFTLPACWIGKSIPEPAESVLAWKQMILRLDDEDEEKEQRVRMGLERQTEKDLAKALAKEQKLVLSRIRRYAVPVEWFREDLEATLQAMRDERDLYDMLQRALLQSVDLGISVGITGLEGAGIGFDYTLAHQAARAWVENYTFTLVSGIEDTTENLLRQSIGIWIENGLPLSDLEEQLIPVFGEKRASLIASTETTRAYQMGSEAAWRESRQVNSMAWVTVLDERVCNACGPRHGMEASLENPDFDGIERPPAHPNCRCFTRAVIQNS